ncbi:MAG: CARDB domain-containing protein, partial [Candidatus Helarchaeota archaeon]
YNDSKGQVGVSDTIIINVLITWWSNITVISDDFTLWNVDDSVWPAFVEDKDGVIHVVWCDKTDGIWGQDMEIMYTNFTNEGWSNATVISDDFTGWNDGDSWWADIAVDNNGVIHVVWEDHTVGEWGTDYEIMYTNYTATGWSNATVISDDSTGWNDGNSERPRIAVDNNGIIYVAWFDRTVGEWGTDYEIMCTNYTATGWSNATVISDDSTGWNDGNSWEPSISIDKNGVVHVVWWDQTAGEWGADSEIMYTNYTATGWSNATVISDDSTGWNDGNSVTTPDISIDSDGIIHVVWGDDTDGEWGTDLEIMYVNNTGNGWTNATVISDDSSGWNDGTSDRPSIAIDDNGNINVVWHDDTDGEWGSDIEIMYINNAGTGWTNATVISDDSSGWNSGTSERAGLIIDHNGNILVFWDDDTNGEWGTDIEIMYVNKTTDLIPTSNHPNDITTLVDGIETINWTLQDDKGTGKYRVLANDSNGYYYVWKNWTGWDNNTNLQVEINRSVYGVFNYTIEFYDNFNQMGNPDIVIVSVIETPLITISPNRTHIDDIVYINGTNFGPFENVYISFDNINVTTVVTNGDGNFFNAQFTVPKRVEGDYQVDACSDSFGAELIVNETLHIYRTFLSADRYEGVIHSHFTLYGAFFEPDDYVEIRWNGSKITDFYSDENGNFTKQIVVPYGSAGNYSVTALTTGMASAYIYGFNFTVLENMPAETDLVISGIYFNDSEPFSEGENLEVNVTINNTGAFDVVRPFYIKIIAYFNDGADSIIMIEILNELLAQNTKNVTFEFENIPQNLYRFEIIIDFTNVINETNENNNNQTVDITPIPDSGLLPDFTVIDFKPSGIFYDNSYCAFYIKIKNLGGKYSNSVNISFYLNGSLSYIKEIKIESFELEMGMNILLSSGHYKIEVALDFPNQITELDDTNNNASFEFDTISYAPVNINVYALIVGVSEYDPVFYQTIQGIEILSSIRDNAQLMYHILNEGYNIPVDNIRILLDSEATKENISSEIANLATIATPDDIVFIYFCAHGGISGGNTYMLVYDNFLFDYEINNNISMFQSGVNISIMFDSCHSGGYNGTLTMENRTILMSCESDEYSGTWENYFKQFGAGFYTYSMVMAHYAIDDNNPNYYIYDDNSDGFLSLEECHNYSHILLSGIDIQNPLINDSNPIDFILGRYNHSNIHYMGLNRGTHAISWENIMGNSIEAFDMKFLGIWEGGSVSVILSNKSLNPFNINGLNVISNGYLHSLCFAQYETVRLTIHYNETDLLIQGLDENSIKIYRFNQDTGEWIETYYTINTVTNTITIELNELDEICITASKISKNLMIFLPPTSEFDFHIILIIIVLGSIAGVTFVIAYKKYRPVSEKIAKWGEDSTVHLKLPSKREFVGISDMEIVTKLKNLFISKISVDSIMDEEILKFFKNKFIMLKKEEITEFLELEIPDISEKIRIFEEFASLSPEDRKIFLENIKKTKYF